MRLQGVVVERAVDGRNGLVVVREQQDGGRGVGRHAALQRVGCVLLGGALLAQQVDERSLVAFALHGRDDRVEEDREGRFETADRRGHRREVSAGREAYDAHFVRRVARGARFESRHDAQGLYGVLQRHFGMVVGHPVFQHGARDAVGGEPFRHFVALVVHGQHAVAAARADDDGLAGGLGLVGREDVESRFGGVPYAVGFLFRFRRRDAVAVGRGRVVPDFEGRGLSVILCRCCCGHKQECCDKR